MVVESKSKRHSGRINFLDGALPRINQKFLFCVIIFVIKASQHKYLRSVRHLVLLKM